MSKEGKLIKKIIKMLISANLVFTVILVVFIGIMSMAIFQARTNSSNGGGTGGNITDIGALGVPQEYVPHYNEASNMFGVPNWVLAAVSKQESNFNPNASYGGAFGIMQIQKVDPWSGKDLWKYLINMGLGEEYKKAGYTFSTSDEMWSTYLKDPRAQIIAGGYEMRYYGNYVLYMQDKITLLDYNNNENMKLINWSADENNKDFRETLRRIFACYNGGPGYGMTVDLDKAHHDYPNKVFKYSMEFRNAGITQTGNEVIEKAIKAGEKWVGKSPYVWGGGRNQEDVDAGRFDCSSFVHYMYASAGVQLGDRASAVTFSMVNMGKEIKSSEMKRGDVIFFDTYTTNGHVGVYLGNNKFIHDGPSRGVEVADMTNPYWVQTFNGNVRRMVE